MKDYNLRSRDIYGEPQQRGGRAWLKVGVFLAITAAATAAYLQFRQHTPAPDANPADTTAPKAGATDPNIIPLTLPPRSASQAPTGPR
jgi:hypothetical protein